MIATLPAADDPRTLPGLSDEALIDRIQQQTVRFFWDGAERASGLAPDRRERDPGPLDRDDRVAIGGSGFGVMALIVAVERGWLTRAAVVERLDRMLATLVGAPRYHGAFPHFLHGRSGATDNFSDLDDGGDLVETALLFQGLLCVREYFDRDDPREASLRGRITGLWETIE